MDDDGLMLNFAVDEPSSASSNRRSKKPSVKVTGGKWKDRRNTKLSLEGRGRGGGSGASKGKVKGPNSMPLSNERSFDKSKSNNNNNTRDNDSKTPFKSNKRKFESTKDKDNNNKDDSDDDDDNDHTAANKVRHIHETSGENGGKNNTYVSSLFTANPEIQKRNYEDENKIESLKPSNAPLADDTTFSGLGINELLSKHLTEFLRYQNPTKIQRMVIPKLLNSSNDLFVQAQTGSGKTLAFALPIFQKLTEIKNLTRTSGLFAIILTPTRELATQIYSVLETLSRCCHRIVPGIVIGGEKKKSEKARLRKGVNILVATPGRLVDHIENTTNLELSDIRYVVMDEGDRLMELGFEESINKILNEISKSSRISATTRIFPTLPRNRINILCSATIKGTVKKLGEVSLENAELISLQNSPSSGVVSFDENTKDNNGEIVKAPDQLIQQILIVPPKLRLVTLAGLLKNITKGVNYSTTIVFFSCADSVDFHFITLTRKGKRIVVKKQKEIADKEKIEETETEAEAETDSKNDKDNKKKQDGNKKNFKSRDNNNNKKDDKDLTDEEKSLEDQSITALTAPLINEDTIIYKLHGSLSQQVRTSTLNHFANSSKDKHTVLLCTDVASRGLDLPEISRVIEYDPPFTVDDHLHRIGRTARAGKEGTASLFLLPGDEEKYVAKIEPLHDNGIHFTNFEKVLKNAFEKKVTTEEEEANKSKSRLKNIGKWDVEATTWQLDAERSLLDQPRANEIATNAFISHIRAYTTHLSSERDCFNVKKLHLGHLAKAFALRETPKKLAANNTNSESKKPKESARTKMYRIADMAFKAQSDEFNIS